MAIGDSNLNVYLFEVGILSRQDDGTEAARTLAVHPLLVAPRSVKYADTSRSTVMQTIGGAIDTRGGRALRQIAIEGCFGVEDRRVGPWGGTGEDRLRAFQAEIVRLGDAVTAAQVRAATGGEGNYEPRLASPGLLQQLRSYNERKDSLFVNFYDFWDGEALQVVVQQFGHTRQHRQGGATGLVFYNLALQEVGPAIGSSPASTVLPVLMDFMTTWQAVNSTIESYDPIDILGGSVGVGTFFLARVAESLEAIQEVVIASKAGVTLMGGGSSSAERLPITTSNSAQSFFGTVARAIEATRYSTSSETLDAPIPRVDRGTNDWTSGTPPVAAGLAAVDLAEATQDVLDGLQLQYTAGSFFGLDPAAYRAWIEADGGAGVGPSFGGSLAHIVTSTDTEESIEAAYGIAWATIAALNEMTTDEAMLPGVELQIPVSRPAGPQGLDGLPTFGSHIGQAAWGVDLDFHCEVDGGGALVTVSGPEVLRQGATVLFEAFGAEILSALDAVPASARLPFVAEKLRGLLLTDPRIVSLSSLDVAESATGAIEATIEAQALNGGSVLVGGPA